MAFETAISGLNAATTQLDIASNNIANVNTNGFKQSRAEFSDIFTGSNLGVSSLAVSRGVRTAAINQQFDQGNIKSTNNNFDLAISGGGFFMLDDDGGRVYSRAGAFGVDRSGFVTNSAGQKLMAFSVDAAGQAAGTPTPLQIDTSDVAPQASSRVDVGVNLRATAPIITLPFDPTVAGSYTNSSSITFYDSLGKSHDGVLYFVKTAANVYETHLLMDGAELTPSAGATITFGTDGKIATPATGQVAYDAAPVPGATDMSLTLNYSGGTPTTQYGDTYSVNALDQDGYTTGRLASINIDDTGRVFARYTNGQSRLQGQLALVNFSNVQGLRQAGNNGWIETFSSGIPLVGVGGSARLGTVQAGALEDSNVNLTEELVKLIMAQRNFQANAQVIQTEDRVTQTLMNMR
ncbi:flagellar hook protein FlgE [Immundisolibacter sp.]|uniref:flagellar hook protein FlgE n=1 Tax=Immundisolibacter sp. TaxID=1934948 RepID=UPI002B0F4177|nr:flagellar hook protein FlgE [Immundisolibacter sp.]MEA3219118.1 Flagellar hook protein FlgE [Immundisolibacter sp.]